MNFLLIINDIKIKCKIPARSLRRNGGLALENFLRDGQKSQRRDLHEQGVNQRRHRIVREGQDGNGQGQGQGNVLYAHLVGQGNYLGGGQVEQAGEAVTHGHGQDVQ